METKNILKRNKVLISLVVLFFAVSAVQSIFIIKLYRSSKVDNTIVDIGSNIDKHLDKHEDFFKNFDLDKQWDPFEEFQSMREQMERMFDDSSNRFKLSHFFNEDSKSTLLPQTDIEDKGDHYIVTMNIPGSKEAEIKVDLDRDTLTVRAQTKVARADNNNNFLRMERSLGRFQRSMTLPGPVNASAMETRYEDGVLTIKLPKQSL